MTQPTLTIKGLTADNHFSFSLAVPVHNLTTKQ